MTNLIFGLIWTAITFICTLPVLFEGEIGVDVNLQWAQFLTPESAKSIIACLVNFKGTASEYTKTIKLHENCWLALEADSTAPTGESWRDYIYNSLGWNN